MLNNKSLPLLLLLLASTYAASNFTCINPEVTNCYKASLDTCWKELNDADTISEEKAKNMDDQNVAKYAEKLLLQGDEFQETWKVEQPGDGYVYFSVLKFEQIGFHEDYEIMQTNLQLMAMNGDESAKEMYFALKDEFEDTFYGECLSTPVNPTAEVEVVDEKPKQSLIEWLLSKF